MVQPKKIFRTKDVRLGFEWSDGTRGAADIRTLRLSCPCALCVDEHTGEKLLDGASVAADITLLKVNSIGRYAAGLAFSDGHNSGIYPYDMLYNLTKTK